MAKPNLSHCVDCSLKDPHPWPLPETEVLETRNEYDGRTVGHIYKGPDGTVVRRVVVMYNQERVVMEREDTGWLYDPLQPPLNANRPTDAYDAGDGEQRQPRRSWLHWLWGCAGGSGMAVR